MLGGNDVISSVVSSQIEIHADFGGVELVEAMGQAGELVSLRTLGFYSHVEPQVKAAATAAGFDLVVPRSRINREGAELATKLLAGA